MALLHKARLPVRSAVFKTLQCLQLREIAELTRCCRQIHCGP